MSIPSRTDSTIDEWFAEDTVKTDEVENAGFKSCGGDILAFLLAGTVGSPSRQTEVDVGEPIGFDDIGSRWEEFNCVLKTSAFSLKFVLEDLGVLRCCGETFSCDVKFLFKLLLDMFGEPCIGF